MYNQNKKDSIIDVALIIGGTITMGVWLYLMLMIAYVFGG